MTAITRVIGLALLPATLLCAAPPSALVSALEHLRDQNSYSWQIINGDPGAVMQQLETRRGTGTIIQQNTSPNLKGQIARNGDILIQREWADGLRLDTIILSDGAMVTKTPEGWLNDREILTAQAEERLQAQEPTVRQLWLRRADRPDIHRPDRELVPFLKSSGEFEPTGDGYIARIRSRGGDPAKPNEEDTEPATDVTVTMNLRGGVISDYEVKIVGTRRTTRSRISIPISEHRFVILSYGPVSRIDIPNEARVKLEAAQAAAGRSRATSKN
ncbi:MAG: hypothetical protein EXS37_12280 [Opitutus sp.]|nr:hypothetical protein [Opitutus sp.]